MQQNSSPIKVLLKGVIKAFIDLLGRGFHYSDRFTDYLGSMRYCAIAPDYTVDVHLIAFDIF